jgi:hypothetical protein
MSVDEPDDAEVHLVNFSRYEEFETALRAFLAVDLSEEPDEKTSLNEIKLLEKLTEIVWELLVLFF